MCDFAVLVRRNNSAKLVLLELKEGAPRLPAIEQLEAGLILMHKLSQAQGLTADLQAYLVSGTQGPRLQRFVKGSRTVIQSGSKRVQVKFLKCGCKVSV